MINVKNEQLKFQNFVIYIITWVRSIDQIEFGGVKILYGVWPNSLLNSRLSVAHVTCLVFSSKRLIKLLNLIPIFSPIPPRAALILLQVRNTPFWCQFNYFIQDRKDCARRRVMARLVI